MIRLSIEFCAFGFAARKKRPFSVLKKRSIREGLTPWYKNRAQPYRRHNRQGLFEKKKNRNKECQAIVSINSSGGYSRASRDKPKQALFLDNTSKYIYIYIYIAFSIVERPLRSRQAPLSSETKYDIAFFIYSCNTISGIIMTCHRNGIAPKLSLGLSTEQTYTRLVMASRGGVRALGSAREGTHFSVFMMKRSLLSSTRIWTLWSSCLIFSDFCVRVKGYQPCTKRPAGVHSPNVNSA